MKKLPTRKNKKILIVYDVAYPFVIGGGQIRLYEIAKNLIQNGCEVTWLCFKTWKGESSFVGSEGIFYVGLEGFRGLYNKTGSRSKIEPLIFTISLLKQKKVNLNQFDIVWSGQWPMLHLLIWSFLPNSYIDKNKLIIDYWEIWGGTWIKYSKTIGWIGYIVERTIIKLLGRKSLFVFISPSALSRAKCLNPSINAKYINNGIELREFEPTPPSFSQSDIVYFGRLKNHKNVDMLIRAVSLCGEVYGEKYSLKIIGDGEEKIQLQQLIKRLKLQNFVEILDNIEDKSALIAHVKRARLFVNPSNKEGGGSITLFEAMALGVPSMFFDVKDGIDPNLVKCDRTGEVIGYVVDEFSVGSLATAINTALSDPEGLARISTSSKEFSKQFGWQNIASQYLKEIDKVINDGC